jgi:hypothetical protein
MDLMEKWTRKELKSLSIDTIEDKYIRESTARMLDNQEQIGKHLFSEASSLTGSSIGTSLDFSSTSNTGAGVMAAASMALQRRVFPQLFAHKVVAVQPMEGPYGLAYALRWRYVDQNKNIVPGVEAAWDRVGPYSGFSGSTPNTSGTTDAGTAATLVGAEAWQIDQTGAGKMPELTFVFARTPIRALTRKLAASFSLEAAMDVAQMHKIDIERKIIEVMQYEVQAEKDRELLQRMKAVCTGGTGNLVAYTGATAFSASNEKWQARVELITKIIDACNQIGINTKQGAGNFVIVSPKVATAIQAAKSTGLFTTIDNKVNATTAAAEIGTIDGRITVYRDQYATQDYFLCGFKGEGTDNAGLIYCPYVDGLVNKAISDQDFSPRVGVLSRYAIVDTLLDSWRYYFMGTLDSAAVSSVV